MVRRPRALWVASLGMTLLAQLLTPVRGRERRVVVVGSVNVDITVRVRRLPAHHETLIADSPLTTLALGGKGANQAVAAARLSAPNGTSPRFVTQFGNDAHAQWLESALADEGLDLSACGRADGHPSGQGIVLLEADGSVTSVVVSGANAAWPTGEYAQLVADAGVLMLQVPRNAPLTPPLPPPCRHRTTARVAALTPRSSLS